MHTTPNEVETLAHFRRILPLLSERSASKIPLPNKVVARGGEQGLRVSTSPRGRAGPRPDLCAVVHGHDRASGGEVFQPRDHPHNRGRIRHLGVLACCDRIGPGPAPGLHVQPLPG